MAIWDVPPTGRVTLSGDDAPAMRPELMVAPGDAVTIGQPLARDRRHPWLSLNSPCAGVVKDILRGARRRIDSIGIEPVPSNATVPPLSDAPTREALVAAGLWPDIRSRPFGGIADPGQEPAAILVTCLFGDPEGPDPAASMDAGQSETFAQGLRSVCGLAECGAVLVFAGEDPTGGAAIPRLTRHRAKGRGRRLGSLMRRFGPVTPERPVWHLDWQAVIGIGRRVAGEGGAMQRILTLRGVGRAPQLLRVHVGTPLADILAATGERGCLVVGAPALLDDGPAVGRFDDRLSLLQSYPAPRRAVAAGPVIATPALEAELPQIAAPALLLRALATGDDETALRLGALDLGAEDVAACTPLCVSDNNYAALLAGFLARQAQDWEAA